MERQRNQLLLLILVSSFVLLLGLVDAQCVPVNSARKGKSRFKSGLTKQPSSTPPPPQTPSSPPPPKVATPPPPPSTHSSPPPPVAASSPPPPSPSSYSPPPPKLETPPSEEEKTPPPPCPSVPPPPEDDSSSPSSPSPPTSSPPPPTSSPPRAPTTVSTRQPISVTTSTVPVPENIPPTLSLTENPTHTIETAADVSALTPASLRSGPFQLKTICDQLTSYPDLCMSTIEPFLGGRITVDDMKVFLHASINATVNETNTAMNLVTDYEAKATNQQMQSRLKGCKKDFEDALENIETAVNAITSADYGTLTTFLSSTITAYSDCDDEFSGLNPLAPTIERLSNVVDNALAIAEGMHWP